jgi:HEAT repeat protein
MVMLGFKSNRTYALIIGISQYTKKQLRFLPRARPGAEAIEAELKKQHYDLQTLYDEEATTDNLLQGINDFFKGRKPTDALVFYFAGHGYRVRNDVLLASSNFNPDLAAQPISRSGLSLSDLRDIYLCQTDAQQVMLILDCCYSGNYAGVESNQTEEQQLRNLISEMLRESQPKGRSQSFDSLVVLTATRRFDETLDDNGIGYSPLVANLLPVLRGDPSVIENVIDENGYLTSTRLKIYLRDNWRYPNPYYKVDDHNMDDLGLPMIIGHYPQAIERYSSSSPLLKLKEEGGSEGNTWQEYRDHFINTYRPKNYIEPELTNEPNDSGNLNISFSERRIQKIIDQDKRLQYAQEYIFFNDILSELLDKDNNWVIIGEPGIGKTSLLEMIGVKCIRESSRVPLFIPLAEYAQYYWSKNPSRMISRLPDISEYIAEYILSPFMTITAKKVEEELREGKYLLLLDALDEIPNLRLRESVYMSIRDAASYRRCKIMMTLRTASYHQNPMDPDARDPFVYKELLPFTGKQIETYIRRWFGEKAMGQVVMLLNALAANTRLQRMLSNPLLLWMMVDQLSSSLEDGEFLIPDKRVDLYSRFVDHHIRVRPDRRQRLFADIPQTLEYDSRREYLDYIANKLHTNYLWNIDARSMIVYLKEVRPELSSEIARQHLDHLVEETGLLQQSRDNYFFSHFTFQEFFTAEFLAWAGRGSPNIGIEPALVRKLLTNKFMDPWWHEVIAIYYARSHSDWVLDELIDKEDNIFATRTLLAVDCLMAEGKDRHLVNDAQYHTLQKRLKQLYHETPYEYLKGLVFTAIKRLNGPQLLHFLTEELAHSEDCRRRAIIVLGQIGTEQPEAIDILFEAYRNESSESGLMRIIINTLIMTNIEKVKTLLQDWAGDRGRVEDIVRQMINVSRRQPADDNSGNYIKMLLDIVDSHQMPTKAEEEIIEELGKTSSAVVDEKFAQWMQIAAEGARRRFLLDAIKFPTRNEKIEPFALELLNDDDKQSTLASINFLGRQHNNSTIERLIEKLYELLLDHDGDSEDLQIAILLALGEMNDSRAESCILDYLNYYQGIDRTYHKSSTWKNGISSLGECGSTRSFNFLSEQLNLLRGDIRNETVKALCRIVKRVSIAPPTELCQIILECLHSSPSDDEAFVAAVVYFLFEFGESEIVELLDLAGYRPKVGYEVIMYLLDRDQSECLRDWPERLKEVVGAFLREYVRGRGDDIYAQWAFQLRMHLFPLMGLDDMLLNALKSPRPSECLAAMAILGKEYDPNNKDVLQALLELLKREDVHPEVVSRTIGFLGEFGEEEDVIYDLLPFLHSSQHQQEAFEALFSIAGRNGFLHKECFFPN